MARPLPVIGSLMLAGLILFNLTGALTAIASVFVSLTVILVFTLKRDFKYSYYIKSAAVGLLAAALLFTGKLYLEYSPAVSFADDSTHEITGMICGDTQETTNSFRYTVKVSSIDGEEVNTRLYIYNSEYISCEYGDLISVSGAVLTVPDDELLYSYRANSVTMISYKLDSVTITATDGYTLQRAFSSLRGAIRQFLETNLTLPQAGVILGLLIGDTSLLQSSVLMSFRFAGVSHLFAVSGLHLTLWTAAALFILKKFSKNKYLATIVTLAVVAFFMILTTMPKSVMRAGFMLIASSVAPLFSKRADSISSLFLSLIIILTINPFSAMSVSLLLSFSACLGILLASDADTAFLGKRIKKIKFTPLRAVLSFINSAVVVSIICTIVTLPVTSLVFGYFSPASVVGNLLCVLPAEALMLYSVVAIALYAIFPANALFTPAGAVADYLIYITDKLSSTVMFSSRVILCIFAFAIAVIFIAGCVYFTKKEKRIQLVTTVSLCLTVIFCVVCHYSGLSAVSVSALAVGDGVCVVLKYNGGTTILGCGGSDGLSYDYSRLYTKISTVSLEALLLPGDDDTSIRYAREVLSTISVEHTIISTDITDTYILRECADGDFTNDISVILSGGSLEFLSNESYCVAYAELGVSVLVVFSSDANPEDLRDEWLSADVLIVRNSIPDILNTESFGEIIICSELDSDITLTF